MNCNKVDIKNKQFLTLSPHLDITSKLSIFFTRNDSSSKASKFTLNRQKLKSQCVDDRKTLMKTFTS